MERIKKLLLRTFKIFSESNMSVYAGYATLFIVTAVFPCIILIISIVNLLPGYSTKDITDVLFKALPDLGSIRELIVSMFTDLKGQSGGLLASVAALTTLWSASKGVAAVQKGLNQLDRIAPDSGKEKDGIQKKVRGTVMNTLKQLLFTLILVILVPALLVFEMLGDSILGIVRPIMEKLDLDMIDSVMSTISSVLTAGSLAVIPIAFLVILLIYAVLPAKRRSLRSQIPGALFTGVGWFAFTALFSFFIPRFYHASKVYGSLASLFLLLMWLRFMVTILFAGGALNRAIEEDGGNG